jgi:hypothetical protein
MPVLMDEPWRSEKMKLAALAVVRLGHGTDFSQKWHVNGM